ncbi:hypothetical protein [Tanticharoenia sakaeratensis]|uniref:Uncharacterized protein n=1 Tax=Tanticharoenia sakaeratensis NBRC 103193 TaxID=1231623 RepID=A0A0D6MIY1_9PROT|nr:hypothetical protein [Tanticharoenia sakaeratensis]GAN53441.1 hypothetical protein Tasa_009_236 [Tanticharoenia sakaeratensis NBRC 103193]GBQ20647.1 hypothetical protein AA103193_1452 [Tanticharoenia sakaeratensis NBRC 103193]
MLTEIERAERGRTTMAITFYICAVAIVLMEVSAFNETASPALIASFMTISATYAFIFSGLPHRIMPASRSHFFYDETARDFRRDALAVGFWASLASAGALVCVDGFIVPLSAFQALRIVTGAGIAATLIANATLELRAA